MGPVGGNPSTQGRGWCLRIALPPSRVDRPKGDPDASKNENQAADSNLVGSRAPSRLRPHLVRAERNPGSEEGQYSACDANDDPSWHSISQPGFLLQMTAFKCNQPFGCKATALP